ncbi:MAG: extracellular solute-binding protein [Chloroflexota bacterium]
MKKRYHLFIFIIMILGCTRPDTPVANTVPTTATINSFWTSTAQPYQDITLHGISENSPPSLYIRDVLAPAFEAETGIRIDLQISNNTRIEQVIADEGREFDFVYIEQDVIYGYLANERLVNLTQLMEDHPTLVAPTFNLDNFTDFYREFTTPVDANREEAGSYLYGIPIEAFIKVYLYRQDLFSDPVIQQQFEAEYHYPLAPAVTFEQYHDIALFFTQYGQDNELELWGTTVQATNSDIASFYEFFETIAPSFGIYDWGISLETYRSTVTNGGKLDSKQAIDALDYWVSLLEYAPPEAAESTWDDVADTFAAGRVAQGWIYGEDVAWLATDTTRSQVVGNVGVALPPTARGVMQDATMGVGYLGYYDGAAFGIPINSANKQATLLWLQYLGQPDVQPAWAINSGRVVHLSTFDDPLVREQDRRINGYYTLMKKQGVLFAGAPPFPFHAQVRDIITPFIHQAIRGDLSATEALTSAAQAVDEELGRLGYSVVR